jgi:hypothetical protein
MSDALGGILVVVCFMGGVKLLLTLLDRTTYVDDKEKAQILAERIASNKERLATNIAHREEKRPKKEKGNTDMPKKIMLWCAAVTAVAFTLAAVAFAGGFITGTLQGILG